MRRLSVCLLFAVIAAIAGCSDSTSPGGVLNTTVAVDPQTGTVITDFRLTAGARSLDGRALEYRWDFESDGTYDTGWSSESAVSHRYASGDTITVTVEARDGNDSGTATTTLVLRTDHGTVVEQIPLPPIAARAYYAGLTNDGLDFWASTWTGDIYKLDGATGARIDSIDGLTNWTGSLVWDGEYLWVAESSYLRKRDPETGEQLSLFPVAYSAQVGGVAWDGEVFYFGSDMNSAGTEGDGLIHIYTPEGTETGALTSPAGSTDPRGLAHDGENLWVVIEDADTLYCVDPDDGSVNWTVPCAVSHGDLTVRDGYLWIFVYTGSSELRKIVP
jgi:hypothetical protein